MSIRVLHVMDKISPDSGVSSVVMGYYNNLDYNRIIFDFMLNEDVNPATRAYIQGNGSRIYIMPGLKFANVFKYISSLGAFYKNNDYKIIHGHVANSAVFYLGLAKKIPCRIIHSHSTRGSDILWKRARNWFLTRFIKAVANRYVACSKEAAVFLFGKNSTAMILNNAISVDRFTFDVAKRREIRKELQLEDKLIIGHVGRFCAVKNHSFLLDVFHEIYQRNRNARLMLIGDGELYDSIVQKVNLLGLNGVVLFLGLRRNVHDYMSAMDVFALPSLFEGIPLVGVEAQASGLPVFISDKVSREIDISSKVHFLNLDKSLWVEELLKTEGLNREKDTTIKNSIFNIETQAERLCRYYEELLKGEGDSL